MIKAQFASWPAKPKRRPRPSVPVPDHDSTLVTIATDSEADALHDRLLSASHRADRRRWATIGTSSSSRSTIRCSTSGLQEIAQRPGRAVPWRVREHRDGSFARRTCTCSPRSCPNAASSAGCDAVLTEGERVAQHGFTSTELDRAKAELLRGIERAYAERDKTASAAVRQSSTWAHSSSTNRHSGHRRSSISSISSSCRASSCAR